MRETFGERVQLLDAQGIAYRVRGGLPEMYFGYSLTLRSILPDKNSAHFIRCEYWRLCVPRTAGTTMEQEP